MRGVLAAVQWRLEIGALMSRPHPISTADGGFQQQR
jgi:hypothetical protein